MRISRAFTTLALTLATLGAWAQTLTAYEEIVATPEKSGGVYYAYPVTESINTPAPKGYEPFYVSHYGRHGSRYLISDNDYKQVKRQLDRAKEAGVLTPLGLDVLSRVDSVWAEAEGRGGELTPLGARQHHDIAQRMYNAFPEVFEGTPEITAASTVVMRCAHSMFAFIEGLKELNPTLVIPRESSKRHMNYLNYHSKESDVVKNSESAATHEYNKLWRDQTDPSRLVASLISDSTYVRRYVDPDELMWGLYWIAVDMQNVETPVSFYDIFTPEELYKLWTVPNFGFYCYDSSYPFANGLLVDNAKNLLSNILTTADEYISEGKNGATLRFGHDGNITPLTALMQLDGCYSSIENPYDVDQEFRNYFISPMASNVQLVFFRNKSGDVIVKVLHNERETHLPAPTDMFPFYKWEDARAALQQILDIPPEMLNK